jgi:hypothetical protein
MRHSLFLETLIVDQISSSVKLMNENLFTPITYHPDKTIKHLHSNLFIDVPLFSLSSQKEDLDQLFFKLIIQSKNQPIEILNTNSKNLKHFIGLLLKEISSEYKDLTIIANSLTSSERLFYQMFSQVKRLSFLDTKYVDPYICIIPTISKIGTIVLNKRNNQCGIVIYEEYIKKMLFHSDADFTQLVAQMLLEFNTGE